MTDFRLRPAAIADLRNAYQWYEGERAGLGEEFLQAVRGAMERATATPVAYSIVHRDTRRVLVRRFPYGLFYRIVDDTVVIVGLLSPPSEAGRVEAAKVMANPTWLASRARHFSGDS